VWDAAESREHAALVFHPPRQLERRGQHLRAFFQGRRRRLVGGQAHDAGQRQRAKARIRCPAGQRQQIWQEVRVAGVAQRPPGGGTDVFVRILERRAQRLTERLIDKPGAHAQQGFARFQIPGCNPANQRIGIQPFAPGRPFRNGFEDADDRSARFGLRRGIQQLGQGGAVARIGKAFQGPQRRIAFGWPPAPGQFQ